MYETEKIEICFDQNIFVSLVLITKGNGNFIRIE